MALGLNLSSGGSSDDIIPYVKYDGRSGRMFRNDRVAGPNGFENQTVDITRNFKAVVDLETFEVGWMHFGPGVAPQYALAPYGAQQPQRPSPDFKQGVRLMMKLHSSCANGDSDVRELTGNSKVFLLGIDALHDAYEAGKAGNAGKLPVVTLVDSTPITSGGAKGSSTNYQPKFEITAWVPRPKDLVFRARSSTVMTTAAPSTQMPEPRSTPPSNGATQVSAPAPREAPAAKQPEMADADDFG